MLSDQNCHRSHLLHVTFIFNAKPTVGTILKSEFYPHTLHRANLIKKTFVQNNCNFTGNSLEPEHTN